MLPGLPRLGLPRLGSRLVPALLTGALMAACATEPTALDAASGAGGGDPSVGSGDSAGAGASGPVVGPVTVVDGAPRDGESPSTAEVDAGSDVLVAGVLHGEAAFGSASGLRVADLATGELTTLDLFEVETDVVTSPGAIHGLARRPGGGVLVASDAGLLHDQASVLLRSPVDAALDVEAMTSVDARATDDGAEQLWIAADGEGLLIDETITGFALEGLAIERVIGVADGVAIASVEGALVQIDVAAPTAQVIASELGAVHGAARAEDGTAWFATDTGLVRRGVDGAVERWTLAAAGETPAAVFAVTAAFGAVVVATDRGIVGVDAEGPFVLDPAPATAGAQLTIDGAGDTWLAAGRTLTRYATATPVTFDADVAPLLAAECASCHAEGLADAPPLAFDDYDAVVELAPSIAQRMTQASSPMPPAGLLPASDTAPLLRWIATGMAP